MEVIRPARGPIFSLKHFCLSFGFLEVGNNIQSRWAWAVLFGQHYLNAITLSSNMLQHKVMEDIPVVQYHLEIDVQTYFLPGSWKVTYEWLLIYSFSGQNSFRERIHRFEYLIMTLLHKLYFLVMYIVSSLFFVK